MKTLNCVVLFVICAQILAVVEAQLLSRLLNRLLFSKRNSEEDDFPPYPRRSEVLEVDRDSSLKRASVGGGTSIQDIRDGLLRIVADVLPTTILTNTIQMTKITTGTTQFHGHPNDHLLLIARQSHTKSRIRRTQLLL